MPTVDHAHPAHGARHADERIPDLALWQTEWCPASHRVRQRLTELGVSFVAHQVPVDRDRRAELARITGETTIPILVAGDQILSGEEQILGYLDTNFAEPPEATSHHEKAAKAKRKELEAACPDLTPATH